MLSPPKRRYVENFDIVYIKVIKINKHFIQIKLFCDLMRYKFINMHKKQIKAELNCYFSGTFDAVPLHENTARWRNWQKEQKKAHLAVKTLLKIK